MDRLLPWLRRSGWAYGVLALVLGVLAWRSGADGDRPQPAAPAGAVEIRRDEPTEYLVHVAGAVRKPGVYRVGGDGRVIQAIRMAGGPTRLANLSGVNLAAPVQDGQQILVPARVAPGSPSSGSAASSGAGGPLSLSSATAEQLDALDGIGPTLAARIVAWRTEHGGFASVDQLLDVPGIGATRLEALRSKVTP